MYASQMQRKGGECQGNSPEPQDICKHVVYKVTWVSRNFLTPLTHTIKYTPLYHLRPCVLSDPTETSHFFKCMRCVLQKHNFATSTIDSVAPMAPKHAHKGKVASAVTIKKNERFIKKPQSPIMGDSNQQLSSDDDEDQHDPEKTTTSGLVPEGLKYLHGVSAGPNTPRTPWHTTSSHIGKDLSPPVEVNDLRNECISAEKSAEKADWNQSQETPGPHYPLEPPSTSPSQAPRADKGKQREEPPHRLSD